MAFGDHSGPPANGRQLRELLELLEEAGHSDYRDARGPMGFTQRQAGGKFTSSEADAFIEQLQIELHGDGPPPGSHAPPPTRAPAAKKPNAGPRAAAAEPPATSKAKAVSLTDVPVEALAAELQRRGWIVLEP